MPSNNRRTRLTECLCSAVVQPGSVSVQRPRLDSSHSADVSTSSSTVLNIELSAKLRRKKHVLHRFSSCTSVHVRPTKQRSRLRHSLQTHPLLAPVQWCWTTDEVDEKHRSFQQSPCDFTVGAQKSCYDMYTCIPFSSTLYRGERQIHGFPGSVNR